MGAIWKVSSGSDPSFWYDCWLLKTPLALLSLRSLPERDKTFTVREYWRLATGWEISVLSNFLPAGILSKLLAVHLTSVCDPDTPVWRASSTGRFSVSSARRLLSSPAASTHSSLWSRIWDFKGPTRSSFTLWSSLHEGLPTKLFLWQRRIVSSPFCEHCRDAVQSDLHLLCECSLSS